MLGDEIRKARLTEVSPTSLRTRLRAAESRWEAWLAVEVPVPSHNMQRMTLRTSRLARRDGNEGAQLVDDRTGVHQELFIRPPVRVACGVSQEIKGCEHTDARNALDASEVVSGSLRSFTGGFVPVFSRFQTTMPAQASRRECARAPQRSQYCSTPSNWLSESIREAGLAKEIRWRPPDHLRADPSTLAASPCTHGS